MIRLNKSTRYALYAAMEMARGGPDRHVTATAVAARYDVPSTVLAKVFQQLVRAGIAVGVRGSGGGYRLARRARDVTVFDIIDALEPVRTSGEGVADARLQTLIDEVDELARTTFASVSLETLTGVRC